MPSVTAIDRLYEEASAIVDALRSTPEVSLQVIAEDHCRKALLLCAASYFERRVCMVVIDYVKDRSGGSIFVESFVRNKAIARQYHTWFKWDERNANQFYGLFGDNFRSEMKSRVKKSDELDESVKAFLEIGHERNKLVHDDYATFPLDKTLNEIYGLYKKAIMFVEQLPAALMECDGPSARTRASDQLAHTD